jgi:hypothetical protein
MVKAYQLIVDDILVIDIHVAVDDVNPIDDVIAEMEVRQI